MMAPSPRSAARHALAAAMGVARGAGCRCFVCGASPYDSAGKWRKVLGAGFSDWDCCVDREAEDVCAGCLRLLSGRPGDDPPPLRTLTVAVIGGRLVTPAWADVWSLLIAPPDDLQVLSWAVSRQKHHVLYAEPCTPAVLRIGSDAGTIDVRPQRDAPLCTAVLALRAGDDKGRAWFSRDEILSGHYSTTKIAARSAAAWAEAEAVIAPRRGDPALQIIVAHAPVTISPTTTESPMIDPTDERAIELLLALCQSSETRTKDGLTFWQALLPRRVQRHSGRGIEAFCAYMMADLAVPPSSPGGIAVAQYAASITHDDAVAVMRRMRERPSLLIALAYDRHKAATAARRQRAKAAPLPADEPPQDTQTTMFDVVETHHDL
jgi:hypothetical protein